MKVKTFVCDKNFTCCNWQYADRREDIDSEASDCGHLIEVADVDMIPHFIDIKKHLPENHQKVLIKRQCSENQIYPEKYETITFYNEPDVIGSGGFGGEYDPPRRTSIKDIIGWLPIEELDKLEVN